MKKSISILLAILTLLCSVFVANAKENDNGIKTYGGFEYSIQNGEITIVKYSGSDSQVTVPLTIEEKPVTVIGNQAFYQCKNLSKITIPKSVTKLGQAVFKDCVQLEKATINCEIATIPFLLFGGCKSLKEVTISNNVNYIDKYAFRECTNLKKFVIPDAATSIHPHALDQSGIETIYIGKNLNKSGAIKRLSQLKKIVLSKDNSHFKVKSNVLFNKKMTQLYVYPGSKTGSSFKVPSTVKYINDNAFLNNRYLKTISLPVSLKKIYESAFSGCKKLRSVTIPKKTDFIGDYAFSYCQKLEKVGFKCKKTIGIGNGVFFSCTSLKEVDYPDYKIETYDPNNDPLFYSCTSIKKVNIAKTVKAVPRYSFYYCSKLKSVTIPENVKSIGKKAFGFTTKKVNGKLKEIKVKNFTIKGKKNSAAYKYAKKNGFKFVAI